MKRLIGLSMIILLATTGCIGSLLRLAGISEPATSYPAPICVVRYVNVAPAVELGVDDCENYWIRFRSGDSLACEIISADGDSMIAIACPAEGDTLGL